MSIYQCEECGCAENTALGWYHYTEHTNTKYNKRKLCSACGPTHYSDGSKTGKCGEWHGRFERVFYPKGEYETDPHGNLRRKEKWLEVFKSGGKEKLKSHKMTKWDAGQGLIACADFLGEKSADLKAGGFVKEAEVLRQCKLKIGTVFNDLNSHVFRLPDEDEL